MSVAGPGEGFFKEQDHWALMDRWGLIEEERVEGISITRSHLSEDTQVEMRLTIPGTVRRLAWHK